MANLLQNPQNGIFYETLFARTQAGLIFITIAVIALFLPLYDVSSSFRLGVTAMLITGFVMLVKGLVIKRPVLILKETSLILRGVRPGRWKLFQLSVTKEVKDDALSLIRLGYIREKIADGLLSYPPGEPSRNAIFQSFLWLKYVEGGKTRDLYYPHTKNIANHRLLMQLLTQKYGDKVELHDWRQPV